MKHRIVITGGGGVTGRAVARSLRHSPIFAGSELYAFDIFQNYFGIFENLFDKYIKLPHVDDPTYKQAFLSAINEIRPSAVLIMIEKEALFWAQNNPTFPTLLSPKNFSELAIDKSVLYRTLEKTGLVPRFRIYNREKDVYSLIIKKVFKNTPVWIRCFDVGSTSGKGAFRANSIKEGEAWVLINGDVKEFMISDVLPGRNFACNLLYQNGVLLQHAIYERLEYFMAKVSPSGITGNICVGKLVNDSDVFENSVIAINEIANVTGSKPNGLYTVDLKGNNAYKPLITEINLRHTAATSAFAQGGCNMAEFQVLAIIGRESEIPSDEFVFPKDNRLLRDIDGLPVYISNFSAELQKKGIS